MEVVLEGNGEVPEPEPEENGMPGETIEEPLPEDGEKPQPGFFEGILGWISEFFAGIFG